MADMVNHPKHYADTKYEPIDVINDWDLNFNLGNTIKYIARAGKKDPAKLLEDLKKADFYLDYEIARLEKMADKKVVPNLNNMVIPVDEFEPDEPELCEMRCHECKTCFFKNRCDFKGPSWGCDHCEWKGTIGCFK